MGLFDSPDIPDPEQTARQGVYADLALMELRRLIEGAAAKGDVLTYDGKTYDFTGLGAGEYQIAYADRMLQELLDLQREFGPQYVKQRIDELQRADPEGQALRKNLYERIRTDFEKGDADRPLAERLQQTVLSELEAGGRLDPRIERDVVQEIRNRQASRGNIYGNAPVAQETAAVGRATEMQKADRQRRALQFLTSGATPEDVDYRRNQQNFANMGAFLGGQTPLAQFGQLSGAQRGAAPFYGGQTPGGLNPNAANQAFGFENANYQSGYNYSQQQVNPWIAGISGAFSGATAAANLGWNPFNQGP